MVNNLTAAGTPPSKIHFIGLSLGGQLAALVAKAVPNIGRLTGKFKLNVTRQSCPDVYLTRLQRHKGIWGSSV
jgi:esterase/lipase